MLTPVSIYKEKFLTNIWKKYELIMHFVNTGKSYRNQVIDML